MTVADGAILAAASAAAGAVNAVAGGGTLLTFPALLATGVPPVVANATNTVAVFPGQISSSLAYKAHIMEEGRRAVSLSVPSLLGGIAPRANHPAALWIVQLLISAYGGYFGAGIGILMLAAMGILLPSSIQHANALKALFGLLIKAAATVYFAAMGAVRWPVASLMGLAATAGGFIGARLAMRLPPAGMRAFAIAVGLFAAGRMLLR